MQASEQSSYNFSYFYNSSVQGNIEALWDFKGECRGLLVNQRNEIIQATDIKIIRLILALF